MERTDRQGREAAPVQIDAISSARRPRPAPAAAAARRGGRWPAGAARRARPGPPRLRGGLSHHGPDRRFPGRLPGATAPPPAPAAARRRGRPAPRPRTGRPRPSVPGGTGAKWSQALRCTAGQLGGLAGVGGGEKRRAGPPLGDRGRHRTAPARPRPSSSRRPANQGGVRRAEARRTGRRAPPAPAPRRPRRAVPRPACVPSPSRTSHRQRTECQDRRAGRRGEAGSQARPAERGGEPAYQGAVGPRDHPPNPTA